MRREEEIMETISINKTFSSLEECKEWEDKNFPDNKYQGRPIVMVQHCGSVFDKEVKLESVYVL